MELKNIKIGLAITGSFCNFNRLQELIIELKNEGASVFPIISEISKDEVTRFYNNKEFVKMIESECENKVIDSIVKAEPIGPKNIIDILLICPCSGNTIAKFVNGITDTTVLMATKSHIRNNKPVVIAISTNDGLGQSLKNIGEALNMKNIYFVPFGQDDCVNKPKSLVLDYSKINETLKYALENKQIQPILNKI